MKPDKIFLLRHGQSAGNVDKSVYVTVPDFALQLSADGRKQAHTAGEQLKALLAPGPVHFYVSPYWRTRQTYQIVALHLKDRLHTVYEDPRIREQEWSGDFRQPGEDYKLVEKRRDRYGHFYFRLLGGESCADVFDRMSDFLNTLHRDFEKRDYPRNAIIVTHGMTMRLFIMRWLHLTVEAFERIANPLNCEYYLLERNLANDRYKLVTEPRHHRVGHKFKFPVIDWEKEMV